MTIGNQLLGLCAEARETLVLAAPFIKYPVMDRILCETAPAVEVHCFTRWRPDEIALGVSDPEIWHLLGEREGASLRLVAHIHAKYYRADGSCLVGSANLTQSALGWGGHPNLELLVPVPATELDAFEQGLRAESTAVDDTIFQAINCAAQQFSARDGLLSSEGAAEIGQQGEEQEPAPSRAFSRWLPSLRHPETLYVAYQGGSEKLSRAARVAAASDLSALAIPPALSGEAFGAYVGALLLQHPVVRQLDEAAATPHRFGAMRDLLASSMPAEAPEGDPTRAWQTLMRWLLFFLPDRYSVQVPHWSEVFVRGVGSTEA